MTFGKIYEIRVYDIWLNLLNQTFIKAEVTLAKKTKPAKTVSYVPTLLRKIYCTALFWLTE